MFKLFEHSRVFAYIFAPWVWVHGQGTWLDFKRVFQGVFNVLSGRFLDLLRCFQELGYIGVENIYKYRKEKLNRTWTHQ